MMMWMVFIVSQSLLALAFLWTLNESVKPVQVVSPEKPAGVPPRAPVFILPNGEFWDLETREVSR